MMVAVGAGKVAQGRGVARDCSVEQHSGRGGGGAGASRLAGGGRVREGGEEPRGVASQLWCATKLAQNEQEYKASGLSDEVRKKFPIQSNGNLIAKRPSYTISATRARGAGN
jgi:hypothetical protein